MYSITNFFKGFSKFPELVSVDSSTKKLARKACRWKFLTFWQIWVTIIAEILIAMILVSGAGLWLLNYYIEAYNQLFVSLVALLSISAFIVLIYVCKKIDEYYVYPCVIAALPEGAATLEVHDKHAQLQQLRKRAIKKGIWFLAVSVPAVLICVKIIVRNPGGPMAAPTAHGLVKTHQSAPLGVVKYRLIDVKTKKTLSEQTLTITNIETANRHIPSTSDKYFEDRYIRIYDDFIIGLNNYGYKNKDDIGGFGTWLNRLHGTAFSWEWYDQLDSNNFKKLQGEGLLRVDFRQRDGYWEIAKMTFVGDHILRAQKFGIIAEIVRFLTNGPKEDWYCIVLDGSYINW